MASGGKGLLVCDLSKRELPWDAWLDAATSDLLPREITLNVVSKRHDLGDWDYPPLTKNEASDAAALGAVLEAFAQTCEADKVV